MDKTIMLAGLIFISLPIVVLTLMIGWLMDDMDKIMGKRKSDLNSGNSVHNDSDSGEYSGMDRYIPSSEEIELVLYNLRLVATPYEKKIIDYLIDKECEDDEE